MVEAKDYSIEGKKVGRGDIQKQAGALNDLPIKQGIFASATDYTAPAKKYANSTHINPSQKPINLLHIRPSTELDRKGRVERIIINIEMKVEINHSYYTSGKSIGNMSKVDDENIVDNAIQKTENDIKTQEFVDLLNSYRKEGEQTYPTDWNKWKLGEEGYPAFE